VHTMGEVLSGRQAELARAVSERLDAVTHRIGQSMQASTQNTMENLTKLNDAVLHLWARVLGAVPGSRLRLQSVQLRSPSAHGQLLLRLAHAGIAEASVQIVAPGTRLQYLAAHAEVDIVLDTFPHGGATTTCEALWMGVPTVTIFGATLLERQAGSLLRCAGLVDWVAHDGDEYVAIAARHAADLEGLAQLRRRLRRQIENSPLFDAPRFAAHLQTALRGMWSERGCRA